MLEQRLPSNFSTLLSQNTLTRHCSSISGNGVGETTCYTQYLPLCMYRGKVCYLRCQLPEALAVYTQAAGLAKEQREIEHIVLYEKGKCVCYAMGDVYGLMLAGPN